jgi:hypothetical protein
MKYIITSYTKKKAKKLKVDIKLSTNKSKKIDVFKNGKKVASIGATGYGDYGTFLRLYGKKYAENRRRLYRLRHKKNRVIKNSNGWYSDNLLW